MNFIEQDWKHFQEVINKIQNGGKVQTTLKVRELLKWRKVAAEIKEPDLGNILAGLAAAEPQWQQYFYKIIAENAVQDVPPVATAESYIAPFVAYARQQLTGCIGFESQGFFDKCIRKLEQILGNYITNALQEYQKTGAIPSESPYPETRNSRGHAVLPFFDAFPVLARICTIRTTNWIKGTALFFERLRNDIHTFRPIAGTYTAWTDVEAITPLNSDIHSYVGEVIKVSFKNGASVIYKPKSPALELFLKKIRQKLFDLTHRDLFIVPEIIDRESYFWQQTIEADAPEEINKEQLYVDAGRFMGLCNLLLLEDYHIENVLISNSRFVSIDNELLFPPYSVTHANYQITTDKIVNSSFYNSLLNLNIIPDLFSLFYNDFTDRYGLSELDAGFSRQDAELLVSGYSDFVSAFKQNEAALTEFILAEVKQVKETRHLVRTTAHYYHLIDFLREPENLKSHVLFSLTIVQHLKRPENKEVRPIQMRILGEETHFIFHFDIPLFFYRLHEQPEDSYGAYGLDRFRQQLANWQDAAYLNNQVNQLRNYLYLKDKSGFYLNLTGCPEQRPAEERVALQMANALSFLYVNLFYPGFGKSPEIQYFTVKYGLPGILMYLATAYKKSQHKDLIPAIENIIRYLITGHEQVYEEAKGHQKVELLIDWLKTIAFINSLGGVPCIAQLQVPVLEKSKAYITKNLKQACLGLEWAGEEKLLEILTAELPAAITPYSGLEIKQPVEALFITDNDTLANGNFYYLSLFWTEALKVNDKELLAEVQKKSRQVLTQRVKSGFKLKSRLIDASYAEGLSGIGLVLFLLADRNLLPLYQKYLPGFEEQVHTS